MANLLSALGLNINNMAQFGLSGSRAVSFFGEEQVEAFIQEVITSNSNAQVPTFNGNAGAFLDTMQEVFEYSSGQAAAGNAGSALLSDTLGNMINAWEDAEDTLQQSTGATFDDVTFSFDPATGVASVNVDGVGGSSINVNDAIQQGFEDAGADTAILDILGL